MYHLWKVVAMEVTATQALHLAVILKSEIPVLKEVGQLNEQSLEVSQRKVMAMYGLKRFSVVKGQANSEFILCQWQQVVEVGMSHQRVPAV